MVYLINTKKLLPIKLGAAEKDWLCFNTVHTTSQWFQTCGPWILVVPRCYCNESASPNTAKAQSACGTRINVQNFIFSITPSIYETCRSCGNHLIKVADRLKLKINVTPNLTMMVTGHDNIKSHLYKYKIIDSSMCPCKIGEQTTDHILCDCELVKQESDKLKDEILRSENWPIGKDTLI